MRTIFFYEYSTAGGAWGAFDNPQLVAELHSEGAAMRQALAADLARAGCKFSELVDAGRTLAAGRRQELFLNFAQQADAVLLLAPEIGGILMGLTQFTEALQRPLLSPGSEFVQLTSSKHLTAERLRAAGVAAPAGFVLQPGQRIDIPWQDATICKPVDGAGSWRVRRLDHADVAFDLPMRVERYYPGISASVAVLCGPQQRLALEPCRQHLGGASGFQYRGGSIPLPSQLADRAKSLALAALAALPAARGYVGIDLVLGEPADGSADAVIEVNPRLTTSYVGLRRAYHQNLAQAWVEIVQGASVRLTQPVTAVEFLADGTIVNDLQNEDADSHE